MEWRGAGGTVMTRGFGSRVGRVDFVQVMRWLLRGFLGRRWMGERFSRLLVLLDGLGGLVLDCMYVLRTYVCEGTERNGMGLR